MNIHPDLEYLLKSSALASLATIEILSPFKLHAMGLLQAHQFKDVTLIQRRSKLAHDVRQLGARDVLLRNSDDEDDVQTVWAEDYRLVFESNARPNGSGCTWFRWRSIE